MRNFIYDMVQLVKKYRTGTMVLLILVAFMGAYILFPRLLMERPVVNEVIPSVVMERTQFNADNRITLQGENLDHVIGVFVNGVWEPDCHLISSAQEQIELQLPAKYFKEAQKLAIQVETRINSDLTALSRKAVIEVSSSAFIGKPEIVGVSPSRLEFDNELIGRIEIAGVNFNEESIVKIDDEVYQTEYEAGSLYITLPFSAWCDADDVTVQVVQYVNGYPSPVKSELYYIDTDRADIEKNVNTAGGKEDDLVMTEEGLRNSQIMVQYLQTLGKERYITILSVKDEATYCLTDDVQNALFNLGLQESLFDAYNYSYLAVINGGKVLFESLDDDLIQYDRVIDGITLHAESAGFYVGNVSTVQVDGIEYSPNQRGMNVVVYDKITQTVIDNVCFDLFNQVQVKK